MCTLASYYGNYPVCKGHSLGGNHTCIVLNCFSWTVFKADSLFNARPSLFPVATPY